MTRGAPEAGSAAEEAVRVNILTPGEIVPPSEAGIEKNDETTTSEEVAPPPLPISAKRETAPVGEGVGGDAALDLRVASGRPGSQGLALTPIPVLPAVLNAALSPVPSLSEDPLRAAAESSRIVLAEDRAPQLQASALAFAGESSNHDLVQALQASQRVLDVPPSPRRSGSEDSLQARGIGAVAIRIDRPYPGTTNQGVQPLAGLVSGALAKSILLFINGEEQILDVWGTQFEGEVTLRPGRNRIRAVAIGSHGSLAEATVEVEYLPPAASPAIRIVRPADGTVFGPSGPETIKVEGEVAESVRGLARVVFNGYAVPVAVRDGRFSAALPVIGPEMTIWAEAQGSSGWLRSSPIAIRQVSSNPALGYALLHLPPPATVEAQVWLMHRPKPDDPYGQRTVIVLPPSGTAADQASKLFAFRRGQEGAYALALDYRLAPGDSMERGWGLVFLPGPNGYRSLRLGPFMLRGEGRATLAKFLLPHGVFWDDDLWFSGTAEGPEIVTKFRYSDGVLWSEPKREPVFSLRE